ncbi:sensor histidine kinase N-terminal domain-containing protein [Chitinivorax sp. PXF-14]|uniref:sensor histidine kinase n=1 Tax=Chitinivorax sp. PXF-14 TaxID=3230488 RepID=UPI0034650489
MPTSAGSLRALLLRWLLLPMLAVLLLGGAITYSLALKYANTAYDRGLFDNTLTLSAQVRLENSAVSVVLPAVARHMLTLDQYDRIYFRVDDLSTGQRLDGSADISLPEPSRSDGQPFFYDSQAGGEPIRVSAMLLDFGAHRVLVQTAETLRKRRLLAKQMLGGVVLPQLMLIAIAVGVIVLGVRRGLAPLRRLEAVVGARAASNLEPLDRGGAPAELNGLIDALNGLLARTAGMLAAQQRFVANAAHQLRTPLAGLKAQTDFALAQGDPAEVRHSLEQLRLGVDRGVRLVQQLLALARADSKGDGAVPQAPVDLCRVAEQVTADWVPAALARGHDLGAKLCATPALVAGEPMLLAELLANLIDNAIRYTPAGGQITVGVALLGGQVAVRVNDTGMGIAEAERGRVCERFYRGTDTVEPGCGLGLAIVSEIAARHGASLRIEPGDGDVGSCVLLLFPAAGPALPSAA